MLLLPVAGEGYKLIPERSDGSGSAFNLHHTAIGAAQGQKERASELEYGLPVSVRSNDMNSEQLKVYWRDLGTPGQ